MIEFRNIEKRFNIGTPDETVLFQDFNLKIAEGEFVSVIGSNGSGKTTMLNLLCGSDRQDKGEILLRGKDITHLPEHKRAKKISRVFQDPKAGTSSDLTIIENMALADNKGKPFDLGFCVDRRRIDFYRELLLTCDMGLENRMNVRVGNLSGGQRQALALIIAGMTDVDLLILDEHTAALDPKAADIIMQLTDKMVREKHLTTLMVTHNLRYALKYGTRILMMHEGNIILDLSGKEKENCDMDRLLSLFNDISIENGNSV